KNHPDSKRFGSMGKARGPGAEALMSPQTRTGVLISAKHAGPRASSSQPRKQARGHSLPVSGFAGYYFNLPYRIQQPLQAARPTDKIGDRHGALSGPATRTL